MKYAILITGILASIGSAVATPITIVSDTGPTQGQAVLSTAAGEAWTETGTYSNVTITFLLNGGVTFNGTGTAYLMNQIGPGTTAANEVATPFAITAPVATSSFITLFSGLNLGPGTYFLLVDGANASTPVGASGTGSPTYTEDSGVGSVHEVIVSGTEAAFAPASTFSTSTNALFFTVTGTAGAASSAPEPGTLAMLGTGFGGLILALRRRARL
jgi:PEP-CTERM motif-containing protein